MDIAMTSWKTTLAQVSRSITIAIVAIMVVGALGYIFNAGFDESRNFSRPSLDYYLLVQSKYVKGFPIPGGAVDIRYHASCGDGPKPPSTAVEIGNVPELTANDLLAIETFVAGFGLTRTARVGVIGPAWGPSTVYEDLAGDEVELAVRRGHNGVYSLRNGSLITYSC